MSTVKNKEATVENNKLKAKVKNEVAEKVTKELFKNLLAIDNIENMSYDITERIEKDLQAKSFMTVNLELSEEQREAMQKAFPEMVAMVKRDYIKDMDADERVNKIIKLIKKSLKVLISEAFAKVGQEVNRGAMIPATAVAADTKSKDHNKIELNHCKEGGDITIPTRGMFLSTNCIDVIGNTIEGCLLEGPAETVDPKTGEVTTNE